MSEVRKIKSTEMVLDNGEIVEYRAFERMYQQQHKFTGFAVVCGGKILRAHNGQFHVYGNMKTAKMVAKTI